MSSTYTETYTLTFGNCAENHVGMQKIGNELKEGINYDELIETKNHFESLGAKCELIDLNQLLSSDIKSEKAYLLIIKKGLDFILKEGSDELYKEQTVLEKDKKAFMYGRVVNKKARYNLCFSDFEQKAIYEEGKGTVYNFKDLPLLNEVRENLPKFIKSKKVEKLQCEGNYYYDVKKTYIGFHSDLERQIVVAIRLGADFPLFYQWYLNSKKIGDLFKTIISHGDIYIMSGKAVGFDGRKKTIPVLRHAAGFEKNIKGL